MIHNNIVHDDNFDSTLFQTIAVAGAPVDATELAMDLGLAVSIVRDKLNKLVESGKLEVEFGRYYLANQPVIEKEEDTEVGAVVYLEARKEDIELRKQERAIETAGQDEVAGRKAVFAKGQALRIIRDSRLYRSFYDTFDQYCQDRLRMSRAYCNRTILAFDIFENIEHSYSCMDDDLKYEDDTNWCQNDLDNSLCAHGRGDTTKKIHVVLPTSERQVRPLAKIQIPAQFQIWREAVEETNGKPTGKVVNRLVKEFIRAEIDEIDEAFRPVPRLNRLRPGDVVRIDAQDDPQLKSFHRCWGIVSEPYEKPYYQVMTWFGTTSMVRMRQAKEICCDRRLAKSICSKLNAVRLNLKSKEKFDPGAWAIIKTIGKLHESEITPSVERMVDTLLEASDDT